MLIYNPAGGGLSETVLSGKRIRFVLRIAVLELLTLGAVDCVAKRIVDGPGTAFRNIDLVVHAVSPNVSVSRPPTPQRFHWNWRDSQELNADQSLRNAKLSQQERQAIAKVIADQLRPVMSELEIKSEDQLRKVALDTRIKMIDLNNDGIPEAVAQGMAGCSPTGNCMFWIFQKAHRGDRVLLDAEAQTFAIQPSVTNGFRDVVLSRHGSATESELTEYQYKDGIYQDVGCYDASWTVLEGDKIHELKEPRITPCR